MLHSMPKPRRNPLTASALGGRILSASQLPLFLLHPPRLYGVLTTTGRKSGKRRRRCIRAARVGDTAYVVAIKGRKSFWLRNAEAHPEVTLRIRGGTFTGTARPVESGSEREAARTAYCDPPPGPFERAEYSMWRQGRSTPEKIRELHRHWFDTGVPLAIDLEA